MKSWYCENNLQKQLQLLTIFAKCSILDVWQGSGYGSISDFEYTRVLNMLGLHRVLNIPEHTWIISGHAWIRLNVSKYVWMCLNLPYWFLFYFPIVIPCLLEHVVSYFHVYTKLEAIVWRIWGFFLEEAKFDFFYSNWKYLICFLLD